MIVLAGAFSIAFFASVAAEQPVQKKVAVLDFVVEGQADPAVGAQLTARISEVLAKRKDLSVIAPDDMRAILSHEGSKQLLGCDDKSCLAELAGALGADLLVAGRVSLLDKAYAISMSLIDAGESRVVGRISEVWNGPSIALLELAEPMLEKLFSKTPEALTGAFALRDALDGSRVVVDGEVRGTVPAGQMAGLQIGAHRLELQAKGYLPFESSFIVKKDKTTLVFVRQIEQEQPLYSQWWVWAIGAGGVLATGAVVSGVILAMGAGAGGETGVNVAVNADEAATGGR